MIDVFRICVEHFVWTRALCDCMSKSVNFARKTLCKQWRVDSILESLCKQWGV